jgi:hypothetical protein
MTTEELAEYAKGNPGAVAVLRQLMDGTEKSKAILDTLEIATTIRGTNLWVLYSDLANKDMRVVFKICQCVPVTVLEDCCSRQDRSGYEIIDSYL